MGTYTVRNKESGKTVTFKWNGASPPTDDDMAEVFKASESMVPQAKEQPYQQTSTGGFIDTMSPEIKGKGFESEPYVRPVLEYGGMTAGATLGSGAGPVGAVAGGGLGYGIGKKSADLIYQKPQESIGIEIINSAKDVASGATMEAGGQVFGALVKTYGKPAAVTLYNNTRRSIEKAIRPGVARQRTAAMSKQYFKKATDAVTSIVLNKDNLNLIDENGAKVVGLPKTLKQFSQSIQQTKQAIFNKYDAIASEATAKGAAVDLTQAANELSVTINSKPLQDLAPDAVKYAMSRIDALTARGSYTPAEAQNAIKILNNSLESFYKNPTSETATKAFVDSKIAESIRRSLDASVSSLPGEYQALKNAYGALSEIEKDVGHRAAIDARKNMKGLMNLPDVFSGAEIAFGFLTANSAHVGRGLAAKGIAMYYRHLVNPNRIVNKMFSSAENIINSQAAKKIPSSTIGRQAIGRTIGYGIKKEEE